MPVASEAFFSQLEPGLACTLSLTWPAAMECPSIPYLCYTMPCMTFLNFIASCQDCLPATLAELRCKPRVANLHDPSVSPPPPAKKQKKRLIPPTTYMHMFFAPVGQCQRYRPGWRWHESPSPRLPEISCDVRKTPGDWKLENWGSWHI